MRDRRIAAPVEEQQRLFAGRQPRLTACQQARRDPAVPGRLFGPHVDRAHLGQFGHAEPGGQVERPYLPASALAQLSRLGVAEASTTRPRRSPRAAPPCRGRYRARHPLVCRRCRVPHPPRSAPDRGRAGTAPTAPPPPARTPPCHHAPQPAPFGHGDARMPFGGARAKPRLDPGQEFRRQRDFRQQDQRLPPRRRASATASR
jgi:hypothetical protein